MRSKFPKLDAEDYPFDGKAKAKPKIRQISKQKYLGLKNHLSSNIIGQDAAIESVVSSLKRSQAGLSDNDRPLGVFLFAGSSGVGKTHLANVLHKYLFGNDYPMVRIDCGEYQHKHENQKLIGSPPGYVGHDEGGQLVNTIRQFPSSVVLLDEVEKAHPDLWNTFLRVFDDGVLTDSKGEVVDFRNAIIIMTTNLGNDKTSDHLLAGGTGFNRDVNYKTGTKKIPERSILERNTNDGIKKHFKPEFLNRIDDVIVFNSLEKHDIDKIIEIELKKLYARVADLGYTLNLSDKAKAYIAEKGFDKQFGARPLKRAIQKYIEDPLAEEILNFSVKEGDTLIGDFDTAQNKLVFTLQKKPNEKAPKSKEA